MFILHLSRCMTSDYVRGMVKIKSLGAAKSDP